MTDTPQLSGRDLARQALAAYKTSARTAPTGPAKTKPSRRGARAGSRRDPIGLGALLTEIGADIPLEAGVTGGTVIDRWATLCPQYADTIQPVAYDIDRGRLDLRPSTHAYAAQLRLLGGQLAKQINDKLGSTVVRSIRVLPVGAITPSSTPAPAAPVPSDSPVRTRETACDGYKDTRALLLEHRGDRALADPYMARALQRQEDALRAGREGADIHETAAALEATARPVDPVEAARQKAIAYKRRTSTEPRTAFDLG